MTANSFLTAFNKIAAFNSAAVNVLFVFLALIVSAGLIFLLVWGIRRERERFGENHVEKDVTTLVWLERYISGLMTNKKKKKATFFLFQIDIVDYEELMKTIGSVQYKSLISDICLTLSRLLPWGIKVSIKSDESIVLYLRSGANIDIEEVAKLIIKNTAKNKTLSVTMNVDLEVNIACISYPVGGENAEKLLKNLELTMVVSRRKGANSYAFFSPEMANKETAEYKYYQEIKDAMKAKEFLLFYQPIVDARSMDVIGSESLIRWKHRTMGVLPPSQFLYVMEQTGDINWVGLWCFEQMVKQKATWSANYENKFFTGINLSQRQLLNPELADELRKIARKYKANPNEFVMEITDMSLYNSSEVAKINLDKIHEYGFKIAFDGFGIEFNSPVALEQMPVDIVKLDSRFWKKAKDKGIAKDMIQMIVRFCNEGDRMLIAQGVENLEDIEFLKSEGIHCMQGYAFVQPREAREFISDVLLTPWNETLYQTERVVIVPGVPLEDQPAIKEKNAEENKEKITAEIEKAVEAGKVLPENAGESEQAIADEAPVDKETPAAE